MLDKEILAHAIGIIKNSSSITAHKLGSDLNIDTVKAMELLHQLEDCKLIVDFDGFFACADLAELN